MNRLRFHVYVVMVGCTLLCGAMMARGQAPETGYAFPAGAPAGSTVEVNLGGYDWTPDTEFFIGDERLKLEVLSEPSGTIVPPPPYWFGPKARGPAFPIPREARARLTIPSDMRPGVVTWRVASANGAGGVGSFVVGNGRELIEDEKRKEPQTLGPLPVTINGRLGLITEVDRYTFTATRTGPITCRVVARSIGSPIGAAIRVHDGAGKLIADAADTEGRDLSLTFFAEAETAYVLSLSDIDFRGNRAHVYRLEVAPGPRVVTAIPAAGQRGSRQRVTFIGYGVASGKAELETVTREVDFNVPADVHVLPYALQTEFGSAAPFELRVSDHAERVESSAASAEGRSPEPLPALPVAVTGVLSQQNEQDRYQVRFAKGETWLIAAEAQAIGSSLDVTLAVLDSTGKEIAQNDDVNGGPDAALRFTAPADGDYIIVVSDISGRAGRPDATYRLAITVPQPGFSLAIPDRINVPLGGQAELVIKATRQAPFDGPIAITVTGLPDGVTVPADLVIPKDKAELKIPFTAANAASTAALIAIEATASAGDRTLHQSNQLLLARTMKPRAKVTPVDKDGGRTVHRGTTYPAPVIIERLEGFEGPVTLQMAAKQGRHRQGIDGHDVLVPPGVTETVYPVYCPEWLETDRTSRMVVNAVTQVPDPTGRVRYLSNPMDGRITMSLEGALMTISVDEPAFSVHPGEAVEVKVRIARSPKLLVPVTLELKPDDSLRGCVEAKPITVAASDGEAVFRIATKDTPAGASAVSELEVTIRAVAMIDGKYPAISQATITFVFKSVR